MGYAEIYSRALRDPESFWGEAARAIHWDGHWEKAYLDHVPGYYLTGDSGYLDEYGDLYVMGRIDDTINVAGHRLSSGAVEEERPLQVMGAINAYHATLAEHAGYRALYLSGGGVAAGSLGLPDLGISTLHDVLEDLRRITYVTELPLLVDADTGFGSSAFNIARTGRELVRAAAAGCHIKDQVQANLGTILALADHLSRKAVSEGKPPLVMDAVLRYMVTAHEIQGVLALENSFNRPGFPGGRRRVSSNCATTPDACRPRRCRSSSTCS